MAVWHINEAWSGLYVDSRHDVRWVAIPADADESLPTTPDALTAPAPEDLLHAGLALWPRGAIWGSPDGAPRTDTLIARFTLGVLAVMAALYARIWSILEQARSRSMSYAINDWERDYGLPSRCGAPTDDSQRLRVLRARVRRMASIRPADFVILAARLGYTVAIEEPTVFRVGQTPLGDGELASTGLPREWRILVRDVPYSRFEAGIGETGVTKLLEINRGSLECEIRRVAPAWTLPVFDYGPHATLIALATEAGDIIATDGGDSIAAVVPT